MSSAWVNCRVDWAYLRHVNSWNTLNNLHTQEPRAVIFAPHMCFSVLFDRGKFEMCASFHSFFFSKVRFPFHHVPSSMNSLLFFYDC